MADRLDPFPFQWEGVEMMEGKYRGRVLLSDEMGLGKTLQVLLYLERNPDAFPVVVVCPASVKYVWQRFAKDELGIDAYVCETMSPPPHGLIPKSSIYIINYDILDAWLDYLIDVRANCVVIDECHYIANETAIRSEAVYALCRGVRDVIGVSGTPLNNRPKELWPIISILRPDVFRHKTLYLHEYCLGRTRRGKQLYDGARNTDRLHDMLKKHCMIRRTKKDVAKQLPDKVRQVIPIKLSAEAWDEYHEADTNFLQWLGTISPTRATAAQKAEAVTKTAYLRFLAAKLKMRQTKEWIRDFLTQSNGKLVVFAIHRKAIESLRRDFDDIAVSLYGDTSKTDRKAAEQRFQNDKQVRLFIGNIHAAGTGLTLTAAQDLLFAELSWRPADHTQAEDRIHRLSQVGTAFIRYAIAMGTIEEYLAELIQRKQKILSRILDGQAVNDFNLHDELLAHMRERTAA
jgi:SWI/SNF-related matrix-associated actin-dependent regulator 1 of chromatin subfamily A